MKNKFQYILVFAILVFGLAGCEEEPSLGGLPDESEVSFTITQGEDAFHWVVENTSTATGVASFNFGNGTRKTAEKATVYYPRAGEYTITMTLITEGGVVEHQKIHPQESTDLDFFKADIFQFLTGGKSKTWVLNKGAVGHLGQADEIKKGGFPANGIAYDSQWAASPGQKAGDKFNCYDDKITFNLDEAFSVKYENNGQSLIRYNVLKEGNRGKFYTNELNPEAHIEGAKYEFRVDYTPPENATWDISEDDAGNYYLGLPDGPKGEPMFPIYDVGAKDNRYKILSYNKSMITLGAVAPVDGLVFQIKLIEEGFAPEAPKFEIVAEQNAENKYLYNFSLKIDANSPSAVNKVSWDFIEEAVPGRVDAAVEYEFVFPKGSHGVTAIVVDEWGLTHTAEYVVTFAEDHPKYIFSLPGTVTYHDFNGAEMKEAPVLMAHGATEIVDNPLVKFPNISSKVLKATKHAGGDGYGNAYITLPEGSEFDPEKGVFRYKVYGKRGTVIRAHLYDKNAPEFWNKYNLNFEYKIKRDNTWEFVEFDLSKVDGYDREKFFYVIKEEGKEDVNVPLIFNDITFFINPGNQSETTVYFDDFQGPHVTGILSK